VYIGRVVWNRREWVRNPETKRKVPVLRPESQWIVTEDPSLRIVPQPLWERVQARRLQQAHTYGGEDGKRRTGRGPKYLLSGLLKCGTCDANFVMADYYRYRCASHLNRGQTVCTNALQVPRALVEERILSSLKRELFTASCFARFEQETRRLLRERLQARPQADTAMQERLMAVEQEIAHLLTAIKAGIFTTTTKAELEKLEAERVRLLNSLDDSAKGLRKSRPFSRMRRRAIGNWC
jgi:hypothetical protein